MTSIILHARGSNCQLKSITHLVFIFQLICFFLNLWSWKHVFHIVPFCPRRYVLKSFMCLEVSIRLRNWNKVKNNIYVMSILLLYQLEIPIFINKLMYQSSLLNSFSFVFFWIKLFSELKWKQNYHFSTINISNSQLETPLHIQSQPMSM